MGSLLIPVAQYRKTRICNSYLKFWYNNNNDNNNKLTRVKVIWQKATSLFYHIRRVAARVAKLLVSGAYEWHCVTHCAVNHSDDYHQELWESCRLR